MSKNARLAIILGALAVMILGGAHFILRPVTDPVAVVPPGGNSEAGSGPVSEEESGLVAGDRVGPFLNIEVAGAANGKIVIDLFEQTAPKHVARIEALARDGKYDGVVFHRVIDGFMAQTGDVQYGRSDGDIVRAGMGGSDNPDLPAEFSDIPFDRGIVGMARSQNPNSANSQFFIMFAPGYFLNGQYTVVGKVTEGLDVLDAIKLGEGQNGAVIGPPDKMASVTVTD